MQITFENQSAPSGKRDFRSVAKRSVLAISVVLVLFGTFVLGFRSSLRLKSGEPGERRLSHLRDKGDAPPEVRVGVLATLRAFENGYLKRDPKDLDSFMQQVIGENHDVLLMGTDAGEWIHGYKEVRDFIRHDWRDWGQLTIDVDDAIVSSSGDVAWVSTLGNVSSQGGRPVRFSAVLTRNGSIWHFRQLQFQYDDSDPSPSDVFHVSTHLKLFKMAMHKFSQAR